MSKDQKFKKCESRGTAVTDAAVDFTVKVRSPLRTTELVLPATVPIQSHTMHLLGPRPRKTFHAPPGTSSWENRLYT